MSMPRRFPVTRIRIVALVAAAVSVLTGTAVAVHLARGEASENRVHAQAFRAVAQTVDAVRLQGGMRFAGTATSHGDGSLGTLLVSDPDCADLTAPLAVRGGDHAPVLLREDRFDSVDGAAQAGVEVAVYADTDSAYAATTTVRRMLSDAGCRRSGSVFGATEMPLPSLAYRSTLASGLSVPCTAQWLPVDGGEVSALISSRACADTPAAAERLARTILQHTADAVSRNTDDH